jgi:hypothetical protein
MVVNGLFPDPTITLNRHASPISGSGLPPDSNLFRLKRILPDDTANSVAILQKRRIKRLRGQSQG